MRLKICKSCGLSKDISCFPKWKRTCKECKYIYQIEWRNKNKKILKSNCIDCGIEYDTVVYSTEKPNIRCRKCSIKNTWSELKSPEKVCRVCLINKSIENFYTNHATCKPCLFKKRNKRYNDRLKTDINFKVRHNLKATMRRYIKSKGLKKDDKMTNIIGCDYSYLVSYIESKFENWMSWDNYGLYNGELNYGWDIDHIIPISSAVDLVDIKKLYHYTNFQPLCSKINRDIKKNNLYYEH